MQIKCFFLLLASLEIDEDKFRSSIDYFRNDEAFISDEINARVLHFQCCFTLKSSFLGAGPNWLGLSGSAACWLSGHLSDGDTLALKFILVLGSHLAGLRDYPTLTPESLLGCLGRPSGVP